MFPDFEGTSGASSYDGKHAPGALGVISFGLLGCRSRSKTPSWARWTALGGCELRPRLPDERVARGGVESTVRVGPNYGGDMNPSQDSRLRLTLATLAIAVLALGASDKTGAEKQKSLAERMYDNRVKRCKAMMARTRCRAAMSVQERPTTRSFAVCTER